MESIKIIGSRPNQNTYSEIILPVREKNKKKITAKNDNFTFVGTLTKAKDVDDSTTILFTGTGQLSNHKKNLVLYDGGWKKGDKHGQWITMDNNFQHFQQAGFQSQKNE